MTDKKWEDGEKVLLVRNTPYGTQCHVRYIHKVYKTGRFVLDPKGDQYRADGRRARYGGRFTVPPHVEKYSETRVMEIKRDQLVSKLKGCAIDQTRAFRGCRYGDAERLAEEFKTHRLKMYDLETTLNRVVAADTLAELESIEGEFAK